MALAQNGAGYGTPVGDCSETNECVVFLNNHIPAQDKLCDSSDFSASWIQGSGKYLIQCRSGDTAEDNVVWVVDPKAGIFGRLNYGRFIKKSTLEKNPNMEIPDKFHSRSLCDPIDMAKLKASDFVLLDKKPSNESDDPYCFAPTYLTLENGKLVINTSNGLVKRGDPDHAVLPVSARDREHLNHLLDALRQWHPQSHKSDDTNSPN